MGAVLYINCLLFLNRLCPPSLVCVFYQVQEGVSNPAKPGCLVYVAHEDLMFLGLISSFEYPGAVAGFALAFG